MRDGERKREGATKLQLARAAFPVTTNIDSGFESVRVELRYFNLCTTSYLCLDLEIVRFTSIPKQQYTVYNDEYNIISTVLYLQLSFKTPDVTTRREYPWYTRNKVIIGYIVIHTI